MNLWQCAGVEFYCLYGSAIDMPIFPFQKRFSYITIRNELVITFFCCFNLKYESLRKSGMSIKINKYGMWGDLWAECENNIGM